MRRKVHLAGMAVLILVAVVFAPVPAQAQPHGHGHVYVGVGWGWGYPYWGWAPYWGFGWGYPYWGFAPYYGYPYDHGHRDNSAQVKLEVTPKDAQVFVDGYFVGIVDDFNGTFERLHLSPGDHEIVIYKPGFRTVKQTIRVGQQQESKIKYKMQQLPAGETAEAPPPPPPTPPPQEEQPQRRPVPRAYPPEQMPPDRRPPSEPPPPAGNEARPFGVLVFRVQPAGAEVLIDGDRWQGPEGDDRLVVQVGEGRHRIEIRKEGYTPFTTEVNVRRGETTPLNVSLPPRGE